MAHLHQQTAKGAVPQQAAKGMVPKQAAKSTMPVERGETREAAPSDVSLRLVGALLALAIATVHVADQGGVTVLNAPPWLGWSFRLIEVGGVLTALVLLLPLPARLPAWTKWAAALLLGAGPFLGYVLTRTVGLPGDPGDVGNWDWVGAVSLFVEAALVVLSASMLLALPPFGDRGNTLPFGIMPKGRHSLSDGSPDTSGQRRS
jgi:hypothetical protein